jgi:hypothetical protein
MDVLELQDEDQDEWQTGQIIHMNLDKQNNKLVNT